MLETQRHRGGVVVTTAMVDGERVGGDAYGRSAWRRAPRGSMGVISRVGVESHLVRFHGIGDSPFSIWVYEHNLEDGDPAAQLAVETSANRRLGQKPEGDEFLDPRDPRMEWFWDDLSIWAKSNNYCGEYDRILAQFQLPARKRDFTGTASLGALRLSATVMARSQREANEIVEAQLIEQIDLAFAARQGNVELAS